MTSSYKTLLHIPIIHHYFLDEGEQIYGVDLSAQMTEVNFGLYNVSEFLTVVPSQKTELTLKNWRARFVMTLDGFKVVIKQDVSIATKPFIDFQSDLYFDFLLKIKDPHFENYTDIEIDRTKLVYISNVAPTAAAVDSETASAIQYVSLANFGAAYTDMNIELSDQFTGSELLGAFGVFRIHLEGTGSEIDLSDGAGSFPASVPTETVVFTNRKTTWRFKQSSDGTLVHTTPSEKPLTKNGYIKITKGSQEFPNPTPELIVTEETLQGMNLIKTHFSEVFI